MTRQAPTKPTMAEATHSQDPWIEIVNNVTVNGMPLVDMRMPNVFGRLNLELPDGTEVLLVPDKHGDARDQGIWRALLEFAADRRPHLVIVIGDWLDLYWLSRWGKPPHIVSPLNAELESGADSLRELKEVSGCQWIIYIMGNHEDRLMRWIIENALSLAGMKNLDTRNPLFTLRDLMGLQPEEQIICVSDRSGAGGKTGGGVLVNDSLLLLHGNAYGKTGSAAARKQADKVGGSNASGDTHSWGYSVITQPSGLSLVSYKLGNILNAEHALLEYASDGNHHFPGFGLMGVEGGHPYVQAKAIVQVEIDGHKTRAFAFGDKLYVASSE